MKKIWAVFYAGFFVLCALQLASLLGGRFWLSDILSEFALHYLYGFCLSFLILIWARKWRLAGVAALGIAVNGFALAPLYMPQDARCAGCGKPLTVVQFNLFFKNARTKEFVDWVSADKEVDVVILSEADTNAKLLEPLKQTFPYSAGPDKAYVSGLAVFSRLPLQNAEWMNLLPGNTDNGYALSVSLLAEGGKEFHVFAVHAPYSLTPELREQRNYYLKTVAEKIHGMGGYDMFVGDFNASPWNDIVQVAEEISGLGNAQDGHGFIYTWHLYRPLRNPADGLMIDQMLVSKNIHVDSRTIGEHFGSDHLPVITRLRLQ